ncbi:MAG: hypothetical protein AB1451_09635 [Nitrospirota bacterium]
MARARFLIMLLVTVSLLATACAGTTLTSVWKDDAYHKTPHKIVVLSMLWNPKNRPRLEDEFVRQLKARGLDAVPGHQIVPEEKPPDKEVMAARLKEAGADTLLLTRLVDKTASLRYSQDPAASRLPEYYGTWPAYYGGGYPMAQEAEYAVAEVNLYDVETEKLIWAAVTQTKLQTDRHALMESYVADVLEALQKQRVLP